ncbi:hypothetical protein [Shewanella sp. SR44-3]|uniref:hypothetical protein n=1 Tax=Shewanella sp. SR44-3 TaxID=2760936 RepID=UPI0015FAEF94|nr:hypothetical protein [Shewanella sp. SR44-3]MBB1270533.1 hypothetical protein [Shewanella sp. SR44-3]
MSQYTLDASASVHFSFRDLIECGDTAKQYQLFILPKQTASWQALSQLATNLLDPIVEQFGPINLSYGFCSPELARKIAKNPKPHIAPALDQHTSHELNNKNNLICPRLGAACDFIVKDSRYNMQQVGQWVATELKFDRLYYYGKASPIHLSYGPDMNQFVQLMSTKINGSQQQRVPYLKGRNDKAITLLKEVEF